jgi:hypothetical protein
MEERCQAAIHQELHRLPATRHPLDPFSLQPLDLPQLRIEPFDAEDPFPGQTGIQLAAEGFNLGEFRHGASFLASCGRDSWR